MTAQVPDLLLVEHPGFAFGKLVLRGIVVGNPAPARYQAQRRYPLPIPPLPLAAQTASSLWRGHVATFVLRPDARLELRSYHFEAAGVSSAERSLDFVLGGDFWLVMREHFDGTATYVPFRDGVGDPDPRSWVVASGPEWERRQPDPEEPPSLERLSRAPEDRREAVALVAESAALGFLDYARDLLAELEARHPGDLDVQAGRDRLAAAPPVRPLGMQAELLAKAGRREEAAVLYLRVLALPPRSERDLDRHRNAAEKLAGLGRTPEACRGLAALARVLEAHRRFLAAAGLWKRAAALDPDALEPLAAIADLYRKQGLREDAARQYEVLLDAYVRRGLVREADEVVRILQEPGLGPEPRG